MNNRRVIPLTVLLATLAISVIGYKILVLHMPLRPDAQVKTWDIEVSIYFEAPGGPVRLELYLPRSEAGFELFDERFVSGDYGLSIREFVSNRRAVWSKREAQGRQQLLYRASVRPLSDRHRRPRKPPGRLPAHGLSNAELAAAQHVLRSVRERSTDLASQIAVLLADLNKPETDANLSLLLAKDDSQRHRAVLASRLLTLEGVPAQAVNGFVLRRLAQEAEHVHWLEVFDNGQWLSYDVDSGVRTLPDNYLPWWRRDNPLFKLTGGERAAGRVTTSLNIQSALQRAGATIDNSALLHFSLFSLPIETRAVYHVLLLVPVGVFLLVVLRNVVGIKTFGTFMPVLIALAFRETELLLGMALFVLLVGLGLVVRFYFDRLKLLVVPRLAAVLIVVILLMGLISIGSHELGLPQGLSIALFPMVIMTMTIERMSIVWEESGAGEALQQGAGSLLVAALAYLVINLEGLSHFIFIFPESLLLLLAATIWLGRYSGYRLTELLRFRALADRR